MDEMQIQTQLLSIQGSIIRLICDHVASSVTQRSGTQVVSNGGQFHETNIEATWNLLGYEGLNTILLHGHHLALYLHLTRALYELII